MQNNFIYLLLFISFFTNFVSNDKDIAKLYLIKRRATILGYAKIGFIGILLAKISKLQIFDNLFYKKLSKNNSTRTTFLLPKRGDIFDRNGVKIATTQKSNKLVYYKTGTNYLNDIKNVYSILSSKPKNYEKILLKIDKNIKRYPRQKVVLMRNLTRRDYLRVKFYILNLKGVEIEDVNVRHYPFDNASSCLIGGVMRQQNIKNEQLQKNLDYLTGFDGIEKVLDYKISGKIGLKNTIVNVSGKKIDEYILKNEKDGDDIKTTIDQRLQNLLAELLEGRNGASTLIDLETGGILAMHSSPNIDPNVIVKGIDEDTWNDITSKAGQSDGLFINKNIASAFPPGSTFKIVSGLTALLNNFDTEKKFKCTGEYKIGNRVFHCWKAKQGGHGFVNFDQAVAQSCNCYFYHLSTKIDCDDIYDLATKLGLGKAHLEDFTNEIKGFIPNRELVKKRFKRHWSGGDNANFTLGQGYTLATPLQLAVMVGRVATNLEIKPQYLFDKKVSFNHLGIDVEKLDKIKHGMWSVINSPYGIAYGRAPLNYGICGKTGSAQVVSQRIDNKDMRSGKVKKEKHSHALFVGFAPYDNPKYAVSVIVEHGIGGAGTALPIGVKLLMKAIDLYK